MIKIMLRKYIKRIILHHLIIHFFYFTIFIVVLEKGGNSVLAPDGKIFAVRQG